MDLLNCELSVDETSTDVDVKNTPLDAGPENDSPHCRKVKKSRPENEGSNCRLLFSPVFFGSMFQYAFGRFR